MNDVTTPVARVLLAAGALLVALAEVRRVVDPDKLEWIGPLESLVGSASVGSSILLAVVGYLATRSFFRAREIHRLAPLWDLLVMLVWILVLQALVFLGTMVIHAVDGKAPDLAESFPGEQWMPLVTFQWNLWQTEHILEVPAELSGVWLLSLLAQLLAMLAALVVLLPKQVPLWPLGAVAAIGSVVIMVMRTLALDFRDPFILAVDTFARADAFLLGLAAACWRIWRGSIRSPLADAAVPVLLGVALLTDLLSVREHYAIQLPATAVVTALSLAHDGSTSSDRLLSRIASSEAVTHLSRGWAAIVAVVTPVAVVLSRASDMHWLFRVVVVAVATAVLVRLLDGIAEIGAAVEQRLGVVPAMASFQSRYEDLQARLEGAGTAASDQVRDEDGSAGGQHPTGG